MSVSCSGGLSNPFYDMCSAPIRQKVVSWIMPHRFAAKLAQGSRVYMVSYLKACLHASMWEGTMQMKFMPTRSIWMDISSRLKQVLMLDKDRLQASI